MADGDDQKIVSILMSEAQRQMVDRVFTEMFPDVDMIKMVEADPDDDTTCDGWMWVPRGDAELVEEVAQTIEKLNDSGEKMRFHP